MSRAARVDAVVEKRAVENRQARERAATEAELAEARAQLEAEERAAEAEEQRKLDMAEMHAAIKFASSYPMMLVSGLRALAEEDERVSGIVDSQFADPTAAAQDAFDRAMELAEKHECLHVVQRSCSRPTMAWANLIARIWIARDRARRKSDMANGWLEAASQPPSSSVTRQSYDQAVHIIEGMEKSK